MSIVSMNFSSYYLQGNHEISIILPDRPRHLLPKDFYGGDRKFKVIWLLHGAFGDHTDWLRKSKIELYARERDLCVVMPSACNSGYANWDHFAMGFSMWDYLTEELMPLIYGWYPVSDQRADNYVAGLSMGGGGAIKLAVNYPEKFAGAAILSASPRNLHEMDPVQNEKQWQRIMNQAGSVEAYLNSYENVWDKLAESAGRNILPRLYFAMGTEDPGYPQYMKFKQYAESIKLKATFEEGPGKHEWRFWDTYIEKAMQFFDTGDEIR